MTPHIEAGSADFPGDSSPQPPFGLRDTFRSIAIWSLGVPHLALWMVVIKILSKFSDLRKTDRVLKVMAKALPALTGVSVEVIGKERLEPDQPYVYVGNHVNIFDMFVVYQVVPHFTRALEHIDHFSWPLIGPLLTAVGQIPVDPANKRTTVAGLKTAAEMLARGESVAVMPEAVRSLDGSVGPFYPGAFRLAIKSKVPVVPLAIRGGRTVNRRGDWRIRPGREQIFVEAPIQTTGLTLADSETLALQCREAIIRRLQIEGPLD